MIRHLRDHTLAYVAWGFSLFCLATHQLDSMRFFVLLAVLAVVVADLATIRRDLNAPPRDGRCPAAFSTAHGDRRCDLAAGHAGYHIRNDGCGRPEYHWGQP